MTYGAETWTLTTQAENKLAAAQAKTEGCRTNTWTDKQTSR